MSTGNLDWHGTPFAYAGAGSGADSLVNRYSTTDRSDLFDVKRVAGGGTPRSASVLRDALGRVKCDSLFYYHYDAWGRLVQVNLAKYSEGSGTPEWSSSSVIRHMVYDGLGRLVRVQAPVVAPVLDPQVTPVELTGEMRSELLYYDGVRRITEVLADPVDPKKLALVSEDLEERQKAEQTQGESTQQGNAGEKTANVSYEKEVQPPTRISRVTCWPSGSLRSGGIRHQSGVPAKLRVQAPLFLGVHDRSRKPGQKFVGVGATTVGSIPAVFIAASSWEVVKVPISKIFRSLFRWRAGARHWSSPALFLCFLKRHPVLACEQRLITHT